MSHKDYEFVVVDPDDKRHTLIARAPSMAAVRRAVANDSREFRLVKIREIEIGPTGPYADWYL